MERHARDKKVQRVIDIISKMDDVPGLVREIVIIDDIVYSVIKEYLPLFKKEVIKLEPMDDLPSGSFPAVDYYTRLYIENGRVLFTELFRESTTDERSELVADLRRSLKDLTKLPL